MNHRLPSSCFGAVSTFQHARAGLNLTYRPTSFLVAKRWNSNDAAQKAAADLHRPEKSALLAVQRRGQADSINPARSTLPAALNLPTEKSGNVFMDLWKTGRAYGGFYMTGVKAVWFNFKAVQELKKQAALKEGEKALSLPGIGQIGHISRAEYQLVHRNNHDIGKLPFFGVLVLIFGEWLPLLVPFMPGVVPGTCRIPKQVVQMRDKAEQRRRISFRQGISEPSGEALPNMNAGTARPEPRTWPLLERDYAAALVAPFKVKQLHHISSTLNLHNSLWDRIRQIPPSFLLRRSIAKRFAYLAADDFLLDSNSGVKKLSPTELEIACEQRGIDVRGKAPHVLELDLAGWLERQSEDEGRGKAVLHMLFRRPNAWTPTHNSTKN